MSYHGTDKDARPMKSLAKSSRRKRRPTLQNGTVPPPRQFNRDVRPREYLTPNEVERLIAVTILILKARICSDRPGLLYSAVVRGHGVRIAAYLTNAVHYV